MSHMTNSCEIVDNVACGQTFRYCRTHKVEPKDCPGAKKEVVFQPPLLPLNPRLGYQSLKAMPDAASSKREFKVGDKVRCTSYITDLTYWRRDWISEAGLKVGGIYVVRRVNNLNKDPALEVAGGSGYGLPQSCFEVIE